MHFFGLVGSLMFFIGFVAVVTVGVTKLIALTNGIPARLVTEQPAFYISLTFMILGTLLFLTGFIGELIARNSPERNNYIVEEDV
jgi:Ca2+/Na+ antiporter